MIDFDSEKFKRIISAAGEAMLRLSDTLNLIDEWIKKNQPTIEQYLKVFSKTVVYFDAIDKLETIHLVCTYDLNYDFAKKISEAKDPLDAVYNYYSKDDAKNLRSMIKRCGESAIMSNRFSLFNQCIIAYEQKSYQLAVIGIYSIADCLLSDMTQNPSTSFRARFEYIMNRIEQEQPLSASDLREFSFLNAMKDINNTPFGYSSFSGSEPDFAHRHWLLHGRSHRGYTENDFIFALLWLDSLIFMSEQIARLGE